MIRDLANGDQSLPTTFPKPAWSNRPAHRLQRRHDQLVRLPAPNLPVLISPKITISTRARGDLFVHLIELIDVNLQTFQLFIWATL